MEMGIFPPAIYSIPTSLSCAFCLFVASFGCLSPHRSDARRPTSVSTCVPLRQASFLAAVGGCLITIQCGVPAAIKQTPAQARAMRWDLSMPHPSGPREAEVGQEFYCVSRVGTYAVKRWSPHANPPVPLSLSPSLPVRRACPFLSPLSIVPKKTGRIFAYWHPTICSIAVRQRASKHPASSVTGGFLPIPVVALWLRAEPMRLQPRHAVLRYYCDREVSPSQQGPRGTSHNVLNSDDITQRCSLALGCRFSRAPKGPSGPGGFAELPVVEFVHCRSHRRMHRGQTSACHPDFSTWQGGCRGCPWGSCLLSASRSATMQVLRAWTGGEGPLGRGRLAILLFFARFAIASCQQSHLIVWPWLRSRPPTGPHVGITGHERQLGQAKRQAKQKAKEGQRGHASAQAVLLCSSSPHHHHQALADLPAPPVALVELSVRGRKRDGPRWLQVPWCPASTPCRPVF